MGYKLRFAQELRRLAVKLDPPPPGRRPSTRRLYENPAGTLVVSQRMEDGATLQLMVAEYGAVPVPVVMSEPEVDALVMALDAWLLLGRVGAELDSRGKFHAGTPGAARGSAAR